MDFLAVNEFEMCYKLLKNTEKILINDGPEIERIHGPALADMP